MRKTIGYIPLDPGEVHTEVAKTTEVMFYEGTWLKLAEVWIPGVAHRDPDEERDEEGRVLSVKTKCGSISLAEKMRYKPLQPGVNGRCANCGMYRHTHKGPNMTCPAKDEKQLPGMKYD